MKLIVGLCLIALVAAMPANVDYSVGNDSFFKTNVYGRRTMSFAEISKLIKQRAKENSPVKGSLRVASPQDEGFIYSYTDYDLPAAPSEPEWQQIDPDVLPPVIESLLG